MAKVLERISRHDYVIPAIQREFVWSPDQMCRLFDSLMRGYPIGTFLFWKIGGEQVKGLTFFEVMRDYHELKHRHSATISLPELRDVTAILDGQQRLTSLNIGLLGSYAAKRAYAHKTSIDAYPQQRLHVDLRARPRDDDELGTRYGLRFLSSPEASRANASGERHWMPASAVLQMEGRDIHNYVRDAGLADHLHAYDTCYTLWETVTQAGAVSYYELENSSLDEVLDIFIRVNSGGTVLSKSDLLLSVATAQFTRHDAREEIHGLVDDLNSVGHGFAVTKDLVLKTGLVATDQSSIGFTAQSFNAESMERLDEAWDDVERALRIAVRLLASFGLSEASLTAHSVITPIADYIHYRGLGEEYVTAAGYRSDRAIVRAWVIRSLLKPGVWGSALDPLFTRLRRDIREHGDSGFPIAAIERDMATIGKSLRLGPEEIADLAETPYRNRRSLLVLSLLTPGADLRNDFHVDHVFPRTRFTPAKLRTAGVPPDLFAAYRDACNRLPNLQLLDGPTNVSKQSMMPLAWAEQHYPDTRARAGYLAMHDMHDLPTVMTGFLDFYEARKRRLEHRLTELLGDPTLVIEPAHEQADVELDLHPDDTTRRRRAQGGSRQFYGRRLDDVPDGPVEYVVAGRVYRARIERGEIVLEDGRRFTSPSSAGRAAHGTSVNGWKAWTRGGRPIAEIVDE